MNVRRWNELKIKMHDLDLDAIEIQISARSRFQISLAFFNLVQDLPHKKCIIIDNFMATPPPPTHTHTHTHSFFKILSLSMASWRRMWHLWYITTYMLRQEFTIVHFSTLHMLVNYAHNYVSHVSMPIITLSVLLPEHIRSILI